jgi:hypothetical protein
VLETEKNKNNGMSHYSKTDTKATLQKTTPLKLAFKLG